MAKLDSERATLGRQAVAAVSSRLRRCLGRISASWEDSQREPYGESGSVLVQRGSGGHLGDATPAFPMSYYIDHREQRKAIFKPYDRQAVRRDLHDARQVSIKLSAANRRYRRDRSRDA